MFRTLAICFRKTSRRTHNDATETIQLAYTPLPVGQWQSDNGPNAIKIIFLRVSTDVKRRPVGRRSSERVFLVIASKTRRRHGGAAGGGSSVAACARAHAFVPERIRNNFDGIVTYTPTSTGSVSNGQRRVSRPGRDERIQSNNRLVTNDITCYVVALVLKPHGTRREQKCRQSFRRPVTKHVGGNIGNAISRVRDVDV